MMTLRLERFLEIISLFLNIKVCCLDEFLQDTMLLVDAFLHGLQSVLIQGKCKICSLVIFMSVVAVKFHLVNLLKHFRKVVIDE